MMNTMAFQRTVVFYCVAGVLRVLFRSVSGWSTYAPDDLSHDGVGCGRVAFVWPVSRQRDPVSCCAAGSEEQQLVCSRPLFVYCHLSSVVCFSQVRPASPASKPLA